MEGVIDDDGVKMMDVTQLMMSVTETWSQFDATLSAHLLLRPGRGAVYREQFVCLCVSVCVCLSQSLDVCMSVCQRAYLWHQWTEILCVDPMWPWLGPTLAALRNAMYFQFYG